MTRKIELSRDEAELLSDLLLDSDHHLALELGEEIRRMFGMRNAQEQREAMAAAHKAALDAKK